MSLTRGSGSAKRMSLPMSVTAATDELGQSFFKDLVALTVGGSAHLHQPRPHHHGWLAVTAALWI